MTILFKAILLCVMGAAAIYLLKRLIFTAHNISVLSNKKNRHDISMQQHGMVFNKKTETLEADQSVIVPFK